MYYDGSNWKWGAEMNQRVLDKWCGHKFYTDHCAWCQETFDISLSAAKRFANYCAPVEKKEPRKMWEIIRCAHPVPDQGGHNQIYQHMASVAIDAVIECYDEWTLNIKEHPFTTKEHPFKRFPEYLKEKML